MDNPEKIQLFLFPVITMALLVTAVVVLWAITHFLPWLTPTP